MTWPSRSSVTWACRWILFPDRMNRWGMKPQEGLGMTRRLPLDPVTYKNVPLESTFCSGHSTFSSPTTTHTLHSDLKQSTGLSIVSSWLTYFRVPGSDFISKRVLGATHPVPILFPALALESETTRLCCKTCLLLSELQKRPSLLPHGS